MKQHCTVTHKFSVPFALLSVLHILPCLRPLSEISVRTGISSQLTLQNAEQYLRYTGLSVNICCVEMNEDNVTLGSPERHLGLSWGKREDSERAKQEKSRKP